MAFATSNVKRSTAGDRWALTGTWTGSIGDSTGTLTVGGAYVSSVEFNILDSQSNEDRPVPTSISTDTSTGISTISVYNKSNVTTGRFKVEFI